jgi:hypothetical protein
LRARAREREREREREWGTEEKAIGSAVGARTGTTPSGRSATGASSLGFSSTPKPPPTPSGSRVSAIGSVPVSLALRLLPFLCLFVLNLTSLLSHICYCFVNGCWGMAGF